LWRKLAGLDDHLRFTLERPGASTFEAIHFTSSGTITARIKASLLERDDEGSACSILDRSITSRVVSSQTSAEEAVNAVTCSGWLCNGALGKVHNV
jgi:hypothetical protein